MIFLIIIAAILVVLLSLTYKRYYPVCDVDSVLIDHVCDKINVIDIRDYNISYNNPIDGSINIPVAYLKRFINEIPNNDVHIVVSNLLERNVGVRLLRQFEFNVMGYTILDPKEKNKNIESLCCKGG
ncbi:hypothetical protein ACQKP0_15520 [Heyndrickxia sp. NPDC080065]|uniref:hypothetical protein n=1 Tax=Heyndrickxia sp. NPDC080065 TaxID=3390568 RepID=UPI003CFC220E